MAAARQIERGTQSGAVLLLVLIMVAAMAVIALEAVRAAQVELTSAKIYRNRRQADELLNSGINLAGVLLVQDAAKDEKSESAADTPNDEWATYFADNGPLRFDTGELSGNITSEDSRLPINRVHTHEATRKALERLLRMYFQHSKAQAEKLAAAIVDFMDADQDGDYEANAYRNAGRSYVPPDRQLMALDELRLVIGMTPALLEKLKPLLSVHAQSVNINLAPPVILAAMCPWETGDDVATELAQDMVEFRSEPDNEELLRDPLWYKTQLSGYADIDLPSSLASVASSIFTVRLAATCGGVTRQVSAVVRRKVALSEESDESATDAAGTAEQTSGQTDDGLDQDTGDTENQEQILQGEFVVLRMERR